MRLRPRRTAPPIANLCPSCRFGTGITGHSSGMIHRVNVEGEERLTRAEFAECIDLVLSGLATMDADPSVAGWRPSMELNQVCRPSG